MVSDELPEIKADSPTVLPTSWAFRTLTVRSGLTLPINCTALPFVRWASYNLVKMLHQTFF